MASIGLLQGASHLLQCRIETSPRWNALGVISSFSKATQYPQNVLLLCYNICRRRVASIKHINISYHSGLGTLCWFMIPECKTREQYVSLENSYRYSCLLNSYNYASADNDNTSFYILNVMH